MQAVKAPFEMPDRGDTIVASVSSTVRRSLDAGEPIGPAAEAQIHRALDLLHQEGAHRERLRKVASISCRLHHIRTCLHSGRVNGYASQRLRLRREIETL
ncbi:hypothetical protein [Sphingosinicella rhizophila]|nr:hypothetical protein [Sphingosinicella sp. GR2756]